MRTRKSKAQLLLELQGAIVSGAEHYSAQAQSLGIMRGRGM